MKGVTMCIILTISLVASKRILFASTYPSKSHHIYYQKIIHELSIKGHELTVIHPPNSTIDGTFKNITEVTWEIDEEAKTKKESKIISTDMEKQLKDMYNQVIATFKDGYTKPSMKKLLEKDRDYFDLIILETTLRLNILLRHFFDAPVIAISSLGAAQWISDRVGASNHPVLYPCFHYKKIYNMSYIEKLMRIHESLRIRALSNVYNEAIDKVFRELSNNEATNEDLRNKINVYAVTTHSVLDFNRPTPPGLIHIGSITNDTTEKPLPKDLQAFLDSSKYGVIYLSFGTNINSEMLPKEKVKIFRDALSKLPYDTLWKWDEKFNNTNNIKIVNWVPQSDVLSHPKLKLFMTHGGLNSLYEAISAEVPLIVIPTKFDQWYNGEQMIHRGIAKKLEIETLNEKELKETITEVIDNPRYRKNIIQLKTIMMDLPQTSMEKFIWWTDYVLRHKTLDHLRSPGANLHWIQYLELELMGILLVVFLLVLWIVMLVIRYILDTLKNNIKIKFL